MLAGLTALREGAWSLDELVEHANRLLPDVLPKDAAGRAAETVNQRLVRHYTTQGLVDEPFKEGREARYLYRHLLQLLALRRLLAEGLSSALAGKVMAGLGEGELEALLVGHVDVQLAPRRQADPGREEFLRRVRQRAGLEPAAAPAAAQPPAAAPPGRAQAPSSPAPPPVAREAARDTSYLQRPTLAASPFNETTWARVEIMDGLELMVRDDFRLPANRLGDEQLLQLLKVTLLHLEQKRRGTT